MIADTNTTATPQQQQSGNSPFSLANDAAYQIWRQQKLAQYPASIDDILVSIADPMSLSANETAALLASIQRSNMAIFQTSAGVTQSKHIPRSIASQLGLRHIDKHLCVDGDGMSPLHVSKNPVRREYIPYTNKPINWHTDGYYNSLHHAIRGMVLYCVNPAPIGGENALIDHELAYIHLRDLNPDYISLLMQPDVMTIPANDIHGEEIRPEQTGPVFSIDPDSGHLHMRYSARSRNIIWKPTDGVAQAVDALLAFLNSESPYIFRHKLAAGQGLICNNVLHKRNGFTDGEEAEQKRFFYRARYYDRIA